MMEVEELRLVELIGWFAFGMLKVGGCCTRYVDADFDFFGVWSLAAYRLVQLPGHKGTVTSVDFHPKEPISESILL